jgi:PAS domain S-box-containing protein
VISSDLITSPAIAEDINDLYENAPCGYFSLSLDGLFVKVNHTFCKWTGFEAAELLGTRFAPLLHIASRIYLETHLTPLLRMQGYANEVALDLMLKNGERLAVLVNAVERRDAAHRPLFLRFMVFNATDRRRYERELLNARAAADKANEALQDLNATLESRVAEAIKSGLKAEESLRQSQKMEAVGQLTGGIAHDFNNLLAGITGSMELLLLNVKRGRFDSLSRYAEAAIGAAKRAAILTHRLLAFSRHQKLEPKPVEVNQLIGDMEDLIRRSIGPAVTLEVIGAGGLWHTLIDRNQLENALLNLCINARDAMPGGGRLTIETSNKWFDDRNARERDVTPGQYVLVSVTDTGAGMPPEVIARAFDPFFTTKPIGVGTGLGLSMVYGFARQSGGHVSIYSEMGQGTTMRIYLPRHRGAIDSPEIPALVTHSPEASRSETILVVDDEPTIRMVVTEVLQQQGYHTIEASDGITALKILESSARIDMLITDVGLPLGLNGRQVADAARLERPDLKVLFITGYAENAAIGNGHLDPAMQMLAKPFTVDELLTKLDQLFV